MAVARLGVVTAGRGGTVGIKVLLHGQQTEEWVRVNPFMGSWGGESHRRVPTSGTGRQQGEMARVLSVG
jgi:hypothetical protein